MRMFATRSPHNVLITGLSGFIAAKVADLLAAHNYQVFGLTRSTKANSRYKLLQIDYSKDDLGLSKEFAEYRFDLVINLASYSNYNNELDNVDNYNQANILLPTKLLTLMLENNCNNFINTSSYWQYNEQGHKQANSLYAASKNAFSSVLQYFSERYSLKYLDLVLYDVYSLSDTRNKLINQLAQKIYSHENFPMTKAEQQISFIHVDDVAFAFQSAMALFSEHSLLNQSYFIHSGFKKSLRDYVEMMLKINNANLKIAWGEKPYPVHQLLDIYLGKTLPNWTAGINIEEGFKIHDK